MTAAEDIKDKSAVDRLFEYLRDLIYNPSCAKLDLSKLPDDFVNLGKGLVYYAECVTETQIVTKALSKGDLDSKTPSPGNEIAAPLKGLLAALKHLTWQTKQVAKGDYKQRVSFMGEFANSFNAMVEQLDENRSALLQEIELNKKKSEALAQNNNLMEAITGNISQWIVVADKISSEWLYVNRSETDVLNNPKSAPALKKWLCDMMSEAPAGRTMRTVELELPGLKVPQYFSAVIHPLHWYERDAVAFVLTDVTSEKKQIHKLETVAYHDPLTKTFNRHYGMELLTEWLSESITFVICFVDLDNLKYVNDKFGHREGDGYILAAVELLRLFSDDVVLCRLGGDEFMLLSRHLEVKEAEKNLEDLRTRFVSYDTKPGSLYNHSMSYGIVQAVSDNKMSASELLGIADEKMYKYKREHKMQRKSTVMQSFAEREPIFTK